MNEYAPIVKVAALFLCIVGVTGILALISAVLHIINVSLSFESDDPYRMAVWNEAKKLMWGTIKVIFTLVVLLFIIVSCSLN